MRLKKGVKVTFFDIYLQRCLFDRWRRRGEVIAQLDALEEMIEHAHLREALTRWALLAWPPVPPVSIAERLSQAGALVSSVAKGVAHETVALTIEGGALVQALGTRIAAVNSAGNRLRMQQALTKFGATVSSGSKDISKSGMKLIAAVTSSHDGEQDIDDANQAEEPKTEEEQRELANKAESRRRSRMLGALLFARSQASSDGHECPVSDS